MPIPVTKDILAVDVALQFKTPPLDLSLSTKRQQEKPRITSMRISRSRLFKAISAGLSASDLKPVV